MMPPEQPERPRQEGSLTRIPTSFETRLRMMIIWEARLQGAGGGEAQVKSARRQFADECFRNHAARTGALADP